MLVSTGLLSGCAHETAVLSGYTKPAAVPTFEIIDKRPAEERKTEFQSLLITSCNYAVRQVGDKDIVPDRISLLRDDLNAALGRELTGKRLIVSHYGIYFNNASPARNNVYGANGGLIAGVMKNMGARCKREQMKGGWFEPDDVTTPYSPFIVEITLTVDGQTHSIRSVYSPDKELSAAFGVRDTAAAVFAAVRKADDKVVLSLRQN